MNDIAMFSLLDQAIRGFKDYEDVEEIELEHEHWEDDVSSRFTVKVRRHPEAFFYSMRPPEE